VHQFDGVKIPYGDRSVDVVMFVDVLHHTDDPSTLLREAARTARQSILIKDHTRNGALAGVTLRFMDWVGNSPHGVSLPYNYWDRQKWLDVCERLGLKIGVWRADLNIYPWPATWIFDRSLHFLARLDLQRS
jgi:SAM-dependent methyltransferase